MKKLKRNLNYLALGLVVAAFQSGTLQAQLTLDPAWRVNADTNKPGFIWNYFSNNNGANTGNSIARAESDVAGQARDAAGDLLPNLGDPNVTGAALAPATPANPDNAVLHFEIAGVINLSKTDGDSKGNFTPDELEPGLNSSESTDGQAAEILTYLTLPAGTITMGVNSDDGFETSAGPNPVDAFGRVPVGAFNGGRGANDTTFSIVVQQAGTYPFRTVWENGGGDSNIEWFTVKTGGTKVLVNDLANGGIPAYRARAAGTASVPYVKVVAPSAAPRQVEQASRNVSVVLADGGNPVDDNSVALKVDGQSTTLTKQRQGNLLTVDTGVLPGFHVPGEAHSALLTFKDSTGTYSRTQQWTFYNLENLILPASPVTGENFDSLPESTGPNNAVPPGWVATNYTYHETAGWDLSDIKSDAFLDMVIISTNNVFPLEDEVLLNDQTQTINGVPLTEGWMSGNLLFSASDGRARKDPDGTLVAQARIVITAPFNLSTVNNPVLTFASAARLSTANWEQMSVEYSVDGGANWLPAIYMRNSSTILLKPDGSYDAVPMFTTVNTNQIPLFPTPGVGPLGGKFGDMIAAPITQALAPYIANRNDGIAARKVEAIRLPQASKKSDVRLRLTHLGSCGWEWGIDNIAFYDIAPAAPPTVSTTINVDFNTSAASSTTYSGTAAAPDTGTIWNGVVIGNASGLTPSFTSGALVASDGSATPVTVSLGNFRQYNAAENKANFATALLTDFAYQPNLGPGGPDSTFAINNLDPAKGYDLYIYGQNGGYALTVTKFTINGVSLSTADKGNISSFIEGTNYVVFRGLSPDASGKISGTFNVTKVADNAAFNGLQIVEAPKAATKPDITAITASNGSVTIKWVNGGTLESSPSLSAPVWTSTGNSSGTFTEAISATGNKFYRVKL